MKRTGYLLAMAAVVFFVGKVCYAEENLIKNYSFEEWTAENPTDWKVNLKEAKVVKSETEQIEGKSSLCLKLSPSGDGKGKASGTVVSSVFPVKGGQLYLFGFWAMTEGSDLAASASIDWEVPLTAEQRQNSLVCMGYGAVPWNIGHRIIMAPEKAVRACVNFFIESSKPSSLYLDSILFCPYALPPQPGPDCKNAAWLGFNMNRFGGEVVDDDKTSSGKTVEVKIGAKTHVSRCVIFGPYADLPPGEYWATWRLKAADASIEKPITLDVTSGAWGSLDAGTDLQGITLKFKEPNKYQEFSLPFVYCRSTVQFRIFWSGKTDFCFDNVTVKQVREFTEEEMKSWKGFLGK